ncbi:MAG TPA: glycosyltransferase family 2 protein [Myxococcota bacterium]|nr:glycosyltransferase family 2 protein [Myxococcota bacterium]HQK50154.1 glycosyltransferase family 2 protein [Myxococcota bacterium]
MNGLDLSLVIPVFNEEQSLRPLHREIRAALDPTGWSYEVLFCDDGSRDGSLDVLRALANEDSRVKVLVMARNYGQTAALDAGFHHASGRVVVPLDADLQNDPADIPDLVRRLQRENVDVVSGWRRSRQDPFWTKTLPSRIANRLVSWVTRVPLHDYGCTMKAYRTEFLREVRLYGEMHRLIPAYVVWAGGRVVEQEVHHRPRQFGQSKYNLSKTLRLLLDLLTVRFLLGYTSKPLYFIGKYGVWTLLLGMLCFAWVLVKKAIWGQPLYTDPFFPVSIFLLLAGVQILLSGLLAELTMRTYFESQGKTPWRLRGTLNLATPSDSPERDRES